MSPEAGLRSMVNRDKISFLRWSMGLSNVMCVTRWQVGKKWNQKAWKMHATPKDAAGREGLCTTCPRLLRPVCCYYVCSKGWSRGCLQSLLMILYKHRKMIDHRVDTLELSFNTMGIFHQEFAFCDFSLVVLHTIWMLSFPLVFAMLRGCLQVWMKSNLFRFIKDRTTFNFSASLHAMMSFDCQWTDIECSSFKSPHYLPPSTYRKLTEHGRCCMQNNQLLTKSPAELSSNSTKWQLWSLIS